VLSKHLLSGPRTPGGSLVPTSFTGNKTGGAPGGMNESYPIIRTES